MLVINHNGQQKTRHKAGLFKILQAKLNQALCLRHFRSLTLTPSQKMDN